MAHFGIVAAPSETLAITLASLASDAALLAGRASAFVDLTTNVGAFGVPCDDAILAGFIGVGTNPAANTRIEVYAVAELDDAPTYPAGLSGNDENKTIKEAEKTSSAFARIASIVVLSTSDLKYPYRASVRQLFGARPSRVALFVAQNTGSALNATASNHLSRLTRLVRKGV